MVKIFRWAAISVVVESSGFSQTQMARKLNELQNVLNAKSATNQNQKSVQATTSCFMQKLIA